MENSSTFAGIYQYISSIYAEILLNIFNLGARVPRMSERTLTSKQVAERYNVAASTARAWFLQGIIPRAQLKQTELGPVWVVPEGALTDFTPPKAGRPRKVQPEQANSTKQASKKKGRKT
jgi:hypothetical protein